MKLHEMKQKRATIAGQMRKLHDENSEKHSSPKNTGVPPDGHRYRLLSLPAFRTGRSGTAVNTPVSL